jgi:cysteine sulfinate desulfinase/cysteine desulfurase-like protein
VRVSLGRSTTAEDVEYFLDELADVVARVRAMNDVPGGSRS